MMARIFAADVILGSATPSLESLYNCSVGRYGLVTLSKRYYDAADSDIEIIDTIAERRKNGMVGSFSRKLIDRVNHCLSLRRRVLILSGTEGIFTGHTVPGMRRDPKNAAVAT